MKYNYYIVIIRYMKSEDYINLFDFEEAVKANWIDTDGNRIWVVPKEEETSITFVYGFNDLDKAVEFYDTLVHAAIGIKTMGN